MEDLRQSTRLIGKYLTLFVTTTAIINSFPSSTNRPVRLRVANAPLHLPSSAMHSLYHEAAAKMTADDGNHFEREGVISIAFNLLHITNMLDTEIY